ncbi:crustacyanin-C1 subunit-like [Homarus americanus]|uniref:Crustacyanin-C1 subunit-like 2 n=1 Tax=Homarus americanus TaxID=6706 RepID=A0A8J5NDK9_HOMAM|nr:crustacyanin-C1 subunit-like [Homarus americanus]KAG7177236.1 Crustacyanin-C1 subunit-like 2 [Homarus americanus]
MNSLSILMVFVASVAADKIPDFVVPGKCASVDRNKLWAEQTPNRNNYAGVWYQFALTNNPYQLIEKCVRNEYSFDGEQFVITSTGIAYDGNLLKRNGKLYPNPFGEPHLSIDYENSFAAPLVILETDYSNYACLYSCIDYNFGYHSDFSFIFSRSANLADKYVKKCEAAFKNINVDTTRFVKTVQGSSCPYDTQKKL